MRLRKVKNALDIINNSRYIVINPKDYKGKFSRLFDNKNKTLEIEIGMGKGRFIYNKALTNPSINYIGIEKYDSVLVRAVQSLDNTDLNNLKLIKMDANEIDEVFYKEVDVIYLNFSDPWPKKRHSSRRLTSLEFLDKYDSLFKENKVIILKTDNKSLFDYSVECFIEKGYVIEQISLDLYSDKTYLEDNISTEYEKRFAELGEPIYYIKVARQ